MLRSTLGLCLALAACTADPVPDAEPTATADPARESPDATPPASDVVTITTDDRTLAARPVAAVRVEGACPFEGCTYGTWTTSAETTVFVRADAGSEAFTVPAETALEADRGFVLLTRLGVSVAERATEVYLDYRHTTPVAVGDTLLVMDSEGEGSFRVWHDGQIAFTGVDGYYAPPGETAPLREVSAPEAQWWAHVTLSDGREGWLWMDQTPPVIGADALGG